MISRAERELDIEYARTRRSFFAVLSLLVGLTLFGFFDPTSAAPARSDESQGLGLGHMTLGLLFIFIAAYLAFPQFSNRKN